MFQYNACILNSLIKQIRKSVAIVSVQCIKLYLTIKQIREGLAIVSVLCIKFHLIIKQRECVAIVPCSSTVYIHLHIS